ncbi:MAG: PilZ domain-containing protein [Candidatus Omnitrophica bacterium]|nr:PilZ domain-containing protein [Candidatus Omnitrophota bacterium]
MIEERRKHQRTKRQVPLKIADKTFDVITETVDMSPSGIYCRITRLLPLMSKIEVVLLLTSKSNRRHTRKIRCQGVVVRSEPIILKDTEKAHYNVAIFFTSISKRDQKTIASYLDSGNSHKEEVWITN